MKPLLTLLAIAFLANCLFSFVSYASVQAKPMGDIEASAIMKGSFK